MMHEFCRSHRPLGNNIHELTRRKPVSATVGTYKSVAKSYKLNAVQICLWTFADSYSGRGVKSMSTSCPWANR
jgi:hypothetical protein